MAFCLLPKQVEAFKAKIKSGEIDPAKLADMSSKERHSFFAKFLGEDAGRQTNALFESKMILKNQQLGIINWAKQLSGLKPEVRRDIIAKVERMTEVLSQKDLNKFLNDLAEQRLGFGVTLEEAGRLVELSKKVQDTKLKMEKGGDRLEYGKAQVEFGAYVDDLKLGKKSVFEQFKDDKVGFVGGVTKSIAASMDNSSIFRQGWKTMFTNPKIWAKNAAKSFVDLVRQFGGKRVMDEVKADILSRKNYDKYKKADLATATVEENFPTSLPEKIPFLGRLYKASETAYTAFLHRTRADVFDHYIKVAERTGVDLTTNELKGIGSLVNSLTGRGDIGALGHGKVGKATNLAFFSIRKVKSDFDVLTAHTFDKKATKFVRKEAAKNWVKVIMGTASVLYLADKLMPGSVEWDPRSSDFGKIKVKNTRFDVSGGMSSMVVLAARVARNSTKSTTDGDITKLNTGKFGARTTKDVLVDYFSNKAAPLPAAIMAMTIEKDKYKFFNDEEATLANILKRLAQPIPVQTALKSLKDPNSANDLLIIIADGLGIGTNTYTEK